MRIKLNSNIELGRDWSIDSYYSVYERKIKLSIAVNTAYRGHHIATRRCLMDKAKAVAIDRGYTLTAGYAIEKFPSQFTAPGMFWVDFGECRHVNPAEGMYHVSGMYPYDWQYMHTVIGADSICAMVREAKYRERLILGTVVVPVFWYPYSHAMHGTETLLRYMQSRNLSMRGKHAEYFR